MREVFQRLKQAILEKQDTMLLTIGTSSGSTPRSQGARMLVSAEGRIAGTVGGGAVECQAEWQKSYFLRKKMHNVNLF